MDMLTIAQAAKRIGVHPDTIRRAIAASQISAVRVGRRNIRIRADEVERLLTPIGRGS